MATAKGIVTKTNFPFILPSGWYPSLPRTRAELAAAGYVRAFTPDRTEYWHRPEDPDYGIVPLDGVKHMNDATFREFLDLLMRSDPLPTDGNRGELALFGFADAEALARGYDNWTVAYHEMPQVS